MKAQPSPLTTEQLINRTANGVRNTAAIFGVGSIFFSLLGLYTNIQQTGSTSRFLNQELGPHSIFFCISVFCFILAYDFRRKHKWTFGFVKWLGHGVLFEPHLPKLMDSTEFRAAFGLEPLPDYSENKESKYK